MATNTTLIEKREELKRRLIAGEYKTLVDVFLNWVNRVIQKITRRPKPLPLWLITIILSLVVNFIVFMASYLTGGLIGIRNSVESFGLGYGLGILTTISTYVFSIATIIVINQSIRRIFVLWRDDILDATESVPSLQAFEDWVENTCNRRLHFLVSIFLCSFFVLVALALTSTLLKLWFSNGFTFGFIILYLINGGLCYQLVMVVLLPTMLHRYDLNLFAADPASSELLSRLSSELIFFVYFISFYSAFFSLAFVALFRLTEVA